MNEAVLRRKGYGASLLSSSSSSTTRSTRQRRQPVIHAHNNDNKRSSRRTTTLVPIALIVLLMMTISMVNLAYVVHPHATETNGIMAIGTSNKHSQKNSFSVSSSSHAHQLVKRDKKGRILHHAITNVSISDLQDILQENNNNNNGQAVFASSFHTTIQNNMTLAQASIGREPLLAILKDAGVTEIDVATVQLLPTWETVVKLYGDKPRIVGLNDDDMCHDYRTTIPRNDASLGVAGVFNTGTNLLAMYLSANCNMRENPQRNHGMRWQVPWGKHMLASHKWTNTARRDERQNKTNVLPVVLVRDPYSWMNSMCKHPYAAKWHHSSDHCPNLVPNVHDYALYPFSGKNIPVRINFFGNEETTTTQTGTEGRREVSKWPSLAHVWTDWNQQYYRDADYPRLMIRFEDLIFHPKEVIRSICDCGGAEPMDAESFIYMVDSAKWGPGHGGESNKKTSLISAMIKYGNEERRLQGFTKEDLGLAHVALDREMMEAFRYHDPLNGQ